MISRGGVNYSLYLVTDPDLGGGRDRVPHIVSEAIAGGVSVVQLRDKHCSDEQCLAQARQLMDVCGDVPLVINDRVEVARQLHLDLHIGQKDMAYVKARRLLDPNQRIGVSIHDEDQLARLRHQCEEHNVPLPDVIGIGPVWDTSTKPDAEPAIGLEGVRRVAEAARALGIASVAIGGIGQSNATAAAAAGADGICVVSAIMASPDPAGAARALSDSIRDAAAEADHPSAE